MTARAFFFSFLLFLGADIFALPYIPGCPLHDSCVRALKQEQRRRQRELRQREAPDDTGEVETGETLSAKKTLGIVLGFQIDLGDFNDKKNDYISLRPSLAYLNSFGGLDIFLSAFYTVSLDDPGLWPAGRNETLETLHRGGLEENMAYTFDLGERFTLALGLDNQNQFNFTPGVDSSAVNSTGGGSLLSYAVLEPSLGIGWDTGFGELGVTNSFPLSYAGSKALDYTASVSFNADIGFGLTISGLFQNLWVDRDSEYGRTNPVFQYGETELILNYWRGPFFASLALTADAGFSQFGVEPYLSYRIKKITLFASLLFNNLGAEGRGKEIRLNQIQGKRDVTGAIPSMGVKLRF
jgi:hypothetical protein